MARQGGISAGVKEFLGVSTALGVMIGAASLMAPGNIARRKADRAYQASQHAAEFETAALGWKLEPARSPDDHFASMEHVFRDTPKEKITGKLPANPRVVLLKADRVASGLVYKYMNLYHKGERYQRAYDGVAKPLQATTPAEANVAVVIYETPERFGRFLQPIELVRVIALESGKVIAEKRFKGGMPTEGSFPGYRVVGRTPIGYQSAADGSQPEGMGKWIAGIVR
jgi:hypothetical protein